MKVLNKKEVQKMLEEDKLSFPQFARGKYYNLFKQISGLQDGQHLFIDWAELERDYGISAKRKNVNFYHYLNSLEYNIKSKSAVMPFKKMIGDREIRASRYNEGLMFYLV